MEMEAPFDRLMTAVKMGHVHYQKTNNVASGPLRCTIWHFGLTTNRTEMSYTRSWLSVNTNIRHSNEARLTAVKLSIRWPSSPDCIAGSFIYPLRSRIFLKFSSDVLFDHGLNSVFWAKPYSLENLFGNNVTVHQPPDLPSVRTTGIPMFNFTLSS